jgi:hypothetical protein
MKKIIQNALSRFILLCTLTLIGLTSYAQFNYVPGTVYTFRTLISNTQAVQMDILYDASGNATVTLTQVSPQTGDKFANHIFLPNNGEYTIDNSTSELSINSNASFYKIIDVSDGSFSERTTAYVAIPSCDDGCEDGSGACTLRASWVGECLVNCCEPSTAVEPKCVKCFKPKLTFKDLGITYGNPTLIIRVAGTITIQ